MSDSITLLLRPNTRLAEYLAIRHCTMVLAELGASCAAKPSVQIVLKGGPEMHHADKLELVRSLIPRELVQDVLIEGRSWDEDDVIDVEWSVPKEPDPSCFEHVGSTQDVPA